MSRIEHEQWARRFLVFLVDRVRRFNGGDKFITYGVLAAQTGYPEPHRGNQFGRDIGITLGVMGHMFDDISVDGERVPLLQTLAVGQGSKLPGPGLREFDSTYPQLSTRKKKDFAKAEYRRIFAFGSRWETLLSMLGLSSSGKAAPRSQARNSGLHNPYGSEGSPEHIRLRDYVAANPSIVGVEPRVVGITEYPLKSGDRIDVVFESDSSIVGVEVKSRRSGSDDLERGLYQCIKYASVLNAEMKAELKQREVSCTLAIEGRLPPGLRRIQRRLGVVTLENVQPGGQDEE